MSDHSAYARRPWLDHYDYWVRAHLTYPGRSLADLLAITAVEHPDRPATQFLGAQLTFLDLKRRSDALAASLGALGIVKGDRVGIMLPNCPQYIIAAFAILLSDGLPPGPMQRCTPWCCATAASLVRGWSTCTAS